MTDRPNRRAFAARPADSEQWIKSADAASRHGRTPGYNARLTIDITPELRGRIKIAAFQRGVTVADMLRDLRANSQKTKETPHDRHRAPPRWRRPDAVGPQS